MSVDGVKEGEREKEECEGVVGNKFSSSFGSSVDRVKEGEGKE